MQVSDKARWCSKNTLVRSLKPCRNTQKAHVHLYKLTDVCLHMDRGISQSPAIVFPANASVLAWAGSDCKFHVTAALALAAHPSHLPAWPRLLCCSERLPWALGPCAVTVVPLPGLMGFAGLIPREICDGIRAGLGQTPLEPSLRLQHV